jgi:hypothetical protein
LLAGISSPFADLAVPCCGWPAAAEAAERFELAVALVLVELALPLVELVEPALVEMALVELELIELALSLAEEGRVLCGWVADGWLLVGAETAVLLAGGPAVGGGCRDRCARNGIIAYTVSETIVTSRTVNREPTMRARGECSSLAGPGRRNAVRDEARAGSSVASRRSISASMR